MFKDYFIAEKIVIRKSSVVFRHLSIVKDFGPFKKGGSAFCAEYFLERNVLVVHDKYKPPKSFYLNLDLIELL